jgi:serine/threonine protein phosphatase PrpC
MTKTNQDSLISKTNINNIKDFNIFGVLDGHGPTGHLISQFAGQFIPNCIINNPEIRRQTNPESIYYILRENNYQIIKQAYMATDHQLQSQKFDSKESGSTCVLIIHIGNHIICANVGDSRAIAVFDEKNDGNLNYLKCFPLSIDYKPDLPEEKNRILMSGGWVEKVKNSFGEEIGPYRVFAPGENYPGLAMSRSIGDLDGKDFGIISEPGIIEYNISGNTKYIVLCSDGVWEFLTNEHVKNVGKEFYLNNNPNGFVRELITQSVIEWKGNDIVIDDITAIALFF